MPSPVERTLKALRDAGWTVHVVEHFNPHVKVRQDFGGFADLLAYGCGPGVVAVNCTTDDYEIAEHVRKFKGKPSKREPNPPAKKLAALARIAEKVRHWLASGNRLLVTGWAKRGGKPRARTVELVLVEGKITIRASEEA